MRAFALTTVTTLIAVIACGPRERLPEVPGQPRPTIVVESGSPRPAPIAPGLRLPEGIAPLGYDLRLELDPDDVTFRGRVEIRTQLAVTTDVVWLHAVELDIASATYRDGARTGALTQVGTGDQMLGFALERPAGPGEIVLVFEFGGSTTRDQIGLFRQKVGLRWYLYAQSESIFARRILPCFDEPRFKVAWRVTLVVPQDQVALGNAPVASERELPDGRREIVLAEIGPLPSYLLAIAVGPFTLVDAGKVGRAKTPVRIAVWPAEAGGAAVAVKTLPKIVDAFERYLDQPMPWPKLDLVAVPRFFGAMENAGLVTFEAEILIGEEGDPEFLRRFIRIAGHEIAHQWFGNLLTHAWWDDLWLSEAFASFLGEKIASQIGGFDDIVLRTHEERREALDADNESTHRALRRPVTETRAIERMFDAIAYQKGQAVLAMFEALLGPDVFRKVVQLYVKAYAQRSVTTSDLEAMFTSAVSAPVGASLVSIADHDGTPVVELALSCARTPTLIATARGGVTVPVCVRLPTATTAARTCGLVGARTELPLASATCPPWVIANADGAGYYRTVWTAAPKSLPPIASMTSAERLTIGDDVAGNLAAGDTTAATALEVLRVLATTNDPYAQLAALSIARSLDAVVTDAARPSWSTWLATRFRARLTFAAVFSPRRPVDRELRDRLLELLPATHFDRTTLTRARAIVDRELRIKLEPSAALDLALAVAAPRGGPKLFDRLVTIASTTKIPDLATALLQGLGAFGPELAPRIVALLTGGKVPTAPLVDALVTMLSRGDTRTAAWRAIHADLAKVLGALSGEQVVALVSATDSLCDPTTRAHVAAAFETSVARLQNGKATLDQSLASIDRCIARQATIGPIAL